MNTNVKETDWLRRLFGSLPEEELPQSFRENMMKRIMAEAEKRKKRSERIGWLSVAAASMGLIALSVGSILFARGSGATIEFKLPEFNTTSMLFYLYIGALALLLLCLDHFLGRIYKKKHN
ncbi:hypothetical protein FACS1894181_13840 [Bacteroidia bacterium]|nr:hypothetical protein FACS1894181_13840 [Bacteroidia bacterium]